MARKRALVEFGMGSSLRREDHSEAACRAVRDALWRNSISVADLLGLPREAMLIEVTLAVPAPEQVDCDAVAALFPYGQVSVKAVAGGLRLPRPGVDGAPSPGDSILANAAIEVFFDL